MRLDVGIPLPDGVDLTGFFAVEFVQAAFHHFDVPAALALLVIGQEHRRCLFVSASQTGERVPEVSPERREDVPCPLDVCFLAARQLFKDEFVTAARAGLHGLFEPEAQRGVRYVPQVAKLVPDALVRQYNFLAVECVVQGGFGLLLCHRATSMQADAGKEDFLVQADAASPDEDHAGDCGDERFGQIVDHDGGHATQGRVHAPQ